MHRLQALTSPYSPSEAASAPRDDLFQWGPEQKIQTAVAPLFTTSIPEALKTESGLIYNLFELLAPQTSSQTTTFKLYAPNAKEVFLCVKQSVKKHLYADEDTIIPMKKSPSSAFWQVSASLKEAQSYQYLIRTITKANHRKLDPFTMASATFIDPFFQYATKLYDPKAFVFMDSLWLENREQRQAHTPISIYRAVPHLWKKEYSQMTSYRSFTPDIIEHCNKLQATHVVLAEMLDQVDRPGTTAPYGFFSVSHLAGGPLQLQNHVNTLHMHGIGVLATLPIDVIDPVHFGLTQLDGTALLEKDMQAEGALDFSKSFTASYLLSAIDYWIRYYHIDGFILQSKTEIAGRYGYEMLGEIQHFVTKHFPGVFIIQDSPETNDKHLQKSDVLKLKDIDFSSIMNPFPFVYKIPQSSFAKSRERSLQYITLMHTLPIHCSIDMGQELGQEQPWQQKAAQAVRDPYTNCVDWPGDNPKNSNAVLDLILTLLKIRRDNPALHNDATVEYLPTLPGLIAYQRTSIDKKHILLCIHNTGDTPRSSKEVVADSDLQAIFTTATSYPTQDSSILEANASYIFQKS